MNDRADAARTALRLCALVVAATIAGCGGDDPSNSAPVAIASPAPSPGLFCFTGAESSDADGSVVAWQWERLDGSSMPIEEILVNDGALLCLRVARMQANDPDPHLYGYRLLVTDDRGATGSTTVEAWVPESDDQPGGGIAVDAGPDRTVDAGQPVTLAGLINAGEFPCTAASCAWEQMTGPQVGVATTGSCQAGTRFDAAFDAPQTSADGVFLGFRLTVFDASVAGCESRDYVAVTVRPAS